MRTKPQRLVVAVASGVLGINVLCAGQVGTTPPPVVWEVRSRIIQVGWNGLFDPSHIWADKQYIKTISNGFGGHAINTTSQSWSLEWAWAGNFPSVAITSGRLAPHKISCDRGLGSDWSGNFVIEDAYATYEVFAWIRGSPGTQYRSEARHAGDWTGLVQDSGLVALSALDKGVTSCSQCPVKLELHTQSLPKVVVADGPTVSFDEFPGVVYTQAGFFVGPGKSLITTDSGSIAHHAGESCILFCGPPSEVQGGGTIASVHRLFLNKGQPPLPKLSLAKKVYPVGEPITLAVEATDPDNPDGDGIIDYEWTIGTDVVQVGEQAATLVWTPTHAGTYSGSVEVADDEGMWATVDFQLVVAGCLADLDGSGVIDIFDFLTFITLFNAADSGANCYADGSFDVFDFICFINAFTAGC